jgi:hypothetical protein
MPFFNVAFFMNMVFAPAVGTLVLSSPSFIFWSNVNGWPKFHAIIPLKSAPPTKKITDPWLNMLDLQIGWTLTNRAWACLHHQLKTQRVARTFPWCCSQLSLFWSNLNASSKLLADKTAWWQTKPGWLSCIWHVDCKNVWWLAVGLPFQCILSSSNTIDSCKFFCPSLWFPPINTSIRNIWSSSFSASSSFIQSVGVVELHACGLLEDLMCQSSSK